MVKRRKIVKRLIVGLLLLVGCTAGNRFVRLAKETQKEATMISVETVMTEFVVSFSTAGIEVHTATATVHIRGSGVFITPNGHILTCAHLFEVGIRGPIAVTTQDGTVLPATLLYEDVGRDLALIKVDGVHQYASLTDSPLEVGQEVLAVGNPMGLEFSTSHGIISHVDRNLDLPTLFTQTDAAINPGNSGGPLFNLKGELIGINARGMRNADGLGFAVSPNVIKEFLKLFKGI